MAYELTGRDAIDAVEAGALNEGGAVAHLMKYADPVDGARRVTVEEARAIAQEDPSLIHAEVAATVCSSKTDALWLVEDGLGSGGSPELAEAMLEEYDAHGLVYRAGGDYVVLQADDSRWLELLEAAGARLSSDS